MHAAFLSTSNMRNKMYMCRLQKNQLEHGGRNFHLDFGHFMTSFLWSMRMLTMENVVDLQVCITMWFYSLCMLHLQHTGFCLVSKQKGDYQFYADCRDLDEGS